jgi:hypothetical protein
MMQAISNQATEGGLPIPLREVEQLGKRSLQEAL